MPNRINIALSATAGILVALAGQVFTGQVRAQSQAAPAFEVASLRQNNRYSWIRRPWSLDIQCPPELRCGVSGNKFNEEAASLLDLLVDAYQVRRFQIAGLPSWGDTGHDVYDIDARVEPGRTPTLDQARQMLQTLLADRFHLKIRHETRELPVYALVSGKNGPKLKPAKEPCDVLRLTGGRGVAASPGLVAASPELRDAIAFRASWSGIPERLSQLADRPVIDKTGFDAPAYCMPDGRDAFAALIVELGPGGGGRGDRTAAPDDAGGPSLFTLIEEKWGLKLEPQKGPVDVLVIDRVERPTEN